MSHQHAPAMTAAAADATPSGCLVAPFAQVLQATRALVREAFQEQLQPQSGGCPHVPAESLLGDVIGWHGT